MYRPIFVVLTSPTPLPPILHVCAESYEVALKRYRLAFGSQFKCGSVHSPQYPPRIYFNLNRDILYHFSKHWKHHYWPPPPLPLPVYHSCRIDAKDIECVGYDLDLITHAPSFRCPVKWDELEKWSSLEYLYLGFHPQKLDREGAFGFVPLQKNHYRDVVAACCPHFYNFKAGLAPRPLSAQVEWLRKHCIHALYRSKQQVRYNKVKGTKVYAVEVVNSSSLMG